MKLFRFFILSVLAVSLCGCEYNFALEGLDEGSKLYVQCLAGNSDRTYINIQKAMGVNTSGGSVLPDVESITLKVNGRECPVEKFILPDPPQEESYLGTRTSPAEPVPYDIEEYYILKRYNLWCTDAPIKAGDEVSLQVKAKGMEEASATTSVPQKIVIQEIKAAPRCTTITSFDNTYTQDYMSFDVTLADVSPDDYIGLTIAYKADNIYEYSDGRTESYSYASYSQPINWTEGTGMIDDIQESQGEWIDAYYNNFFIDSYYSRGMQLISGKNLKNGHLVFDCYIPYSSENYSDTYDYDDELGQLVLSGQVHLITECRYQLNLYRVSPEFFRYNKAQYLLRTNYLAELGLSPSTFSYTNLRGGFGVLGSLTCTSTPWYLSPARPE